MRRVFVSFDCDHDQDLLNALHGQSVYPGSLLNLADWSLSEAFTGDWRVRLTARIKETDLTIVLCGARTDRASGVAQELRISRELAKPYFLLHGRDGRDSRKPVTALPTDKLYVWTWENLEKLLAGQR